MEEKIRTIACRIYGADDIQIQPEAQTQIDRYKKQVCCLSTWYVISLSISRPFSQDPLKIVTLPIKKIFFCQLLLDLLMSLECQ